MSMAARPHTGSRSEVQSVGGHSLVYAVSSLVGQLGTLLTFPLYTRALGAREYGVLALMLSASGVIRTLVISGMNTSLMHARVSSDPEDSARITTAACVWSSVVSVFFGFGVVLVAPAAGRLFGVVLDDTLVVAITVFVGFDALYEMILATARAESRPGAYALSNLVRVVVTFSAAMLLLLGLQTGVAGAVYGMAIGSGSAALVLARSLKFIPRFNGSLSRLPGLLRNGAPLVPANLASWVSNLSDRYLLLFLGGSATVVGQYSAGYRLGALVTTLFVGPFHTAFLPLMLKHQHEGTDGPVYRDSSRAFLVLGSLAVCALQFVAVPAVAILAGSEFIGAERVVGTVAFGCLLMGAAMLMTPSALTAGRPHLLSLAFGSGALVNVAANVILIPTLGMVGAGVATLLGYAVVLGAMLRVTPPEMRPPEVRHTLIRVLPVMAATTIPSSWDFGSPALQWGASAALSVAGAVGLMVTGALTSSDARQARNAVGAILASGVERLVPRYGFVGPRVRFVGKTVSRVPGAIRMLSAARARAVVRADEVIGGHDLTPPYLTYLNSHTDLLEVATEDARRIIDGEMVTFGHQWKWSGGRDWHLDPISGRRWAFVPAGLIDVNRVVRDSDVQCVWEASRLEHVWRVALEYSRTGDERCAQWVIAQLGSWRRWNPVGWGVNWIVTMEIALRAVAIAEIRSCIHSSVHWDEKTEKSTCGMLADHVEWSLANLEHRGAGTQNHYLAALVGVLAVAAHLPEWRRMQEEAPRLLQCLVDSFEHQVLRDGVDFENSLGYHLLVCELMGHAIAASRSMGLSVPARVIDRLASMVNFAKAMEFGDESPVAFGDDDDDYLAPAAVSHFRSDRPPLQQRLAFTCAAADIEWPMSRPGPPIAFPEAGVYILGDERIRVFVNAMPTGVGGTGPHRHNDALSFCLEADGAPVFVDPGTYRYQGSGDDRDRYRSTGYHNTVQVDGYEQNRFVGPFALAEDRISIEPAEATIERGRQRVLASHHGFVGDSGLIHTREWIYDPTAQVLRVADTFCDSFNRDGSQHTFAARLHLAPGAEIALERTVLGFSADFGSVEVSAVVGGGSAVAVSLVPSMYSPYYRRETPTRFLQVVWTGTSSSHLTTTVRITEGTDS